jgi:hypothetical protein
MTVCMARPSAKNAPPVHGKGRIQVESDQHNIEPHPLGEKWPPRVSKVLEPGQGTHP